MAKRDVRTSKDLDWDDEVQDQIDKLRKVIRWSEDLENWGDSNKAWHTERTSGRICHYLELATLDLYDLQYFKPDESDK